MPQAAAMCPGSAMPQFVKTAEHLLGDNGHKPCGYRAATTLAVHEARVEVDAIARVEREFLVLDRDDDRALEHQVEFLTAVFTSFAGSSDGSSTTSSGCMILSRMRHAKSS